MMNSSGMHQGGIPVGLLVLTSIIGLFAAGAGLSLPMNVPPAFADAPTATPTPEPTATPTPEPTPTPTPEPTATPTPTPASTSTSTPAAEPCPPILDFSGLPAGTVLSEQYAASGIHISAVARGRRPNALIVFDSNASGTPDHDLEVDRGNLAIIPENVTDGNGDGLVDVPDDSVAGGTQVYTFDQNRVVSSFIFVDKDAGEPGSAVAFDASNNVIASVPIPNAGNASVQKIVMNAANVRRLEIRYIHDSGGVTDIDFGCDARTPTPTPTPSASSLVSPNRVAQVLPQVFPAGGGLGAGGGGDPVLITLALAGAALLLGGGWVVWANRRRVS